MFVSSKKIILGGLIVGTLILGGNVLITDIKIQQLPEHQKLKTDKTLIVGSKDYGLDKKYAYKTNQIIDLPNEVVNKRGRNIRVFTTGRNNELKAEIISGDGQYMNDNGTWYQVDYATTTKEAFDLQTTPTLIEKIVLGDKLYAATGTFYPDPNVESTSVDGYVGRLWVAGESFATLRGAATGTAADDLAATGAEPYASHDSGNNTYAIKRTYYLFDTSSLGAGSTISAAVLSIYTTGGASTDATSIGIIQTAPASNTALTTADYNDVTLTFVSTTILITSLSAGGYNDFTLDATGRSAVSVTGISKFGATTALDVNNSAPSSNATNKVDVSSYADATGTANDPKLVVTYTAAAVSSPKQDVIFFE